MQQDSQSQLLIDCGQLMDLMARSLDGVKPRCAQVQGLLDGALRALFSGRSHVIGFCYRIPPSRDKWEILDQFSSVRWEEEQARFAPLTSPDVADALGPITACVCQYLATKPRTPKARAATDWLGEDTFHETRAFRQYFSPASVQDVLGAHWDAGDGIAIGVGVHRTDGQPPYSPREATLIELLIRALVPIAAGDYLSRAKVSSQFSELYDLSRAQTRVLELALQGHTERDIADRIHRSHHTVHSHLKEIYRKLKVSSRAELLVLAIDNKLRPAK